jgi:hypothetical protein
VTISRRSFLSALGIAASGVALVPKMRVANRWLIPESIVAYDGPVSLEWILAESLAALAANLSFEQFRHVDEPSKLFAGASHRGIDFEMNDRNLQLSRKEFREIYIEPAMGCMAEEIKFLKPRTCLALDVPQAVEFAGRMVNEKHGLDLRFIRAWDMGSTVDTYTDEETGRVIELPSRPPAWRNRFDILVA